MVDLAMRRPSWKKPLEVLLGRLGRMRFAPLLTSSRTTSRTFLQKSRSTYLMRTLNTTLVVLVSIVTIIVFAIVGMRWEWIRWHFLDLNFYQVFSILSTMLLGVGLSFIANHKRTSLQRRKDYLIKRIGSIMEGLGTYQNRLLELGSDMRPENKKQIMTLLRDLANEFTNTLVITFPDEKTKGLFEASKGDIDTLKSEV